MEIEKCIFCGEKLISSTRQDRKSTFINDCPCCGKYFIGEDSQDDLPYDLQRKYAYKKHLISGYLREMGDRHIITDMITSDNIESFFSNSYVPQNPAEKVDKLLLFFLRNTSYFGEIFDLRKESGSICYAINNQEFNEIIKVLESCGFIEAFADGIYKLTYLGFIKAKEIEKTNVISRQVFVAMWFSEELDSIYNNYIIKAIQDSKESNFFKPVRIDKEPHINKICDEIIANIRKSRFLIADLTGQRGGVYYEAGFAHGLGIPVIYSCRKDWFNGYVKQELTFFNEIPNSNPTEYEYKEKTEKILHEYVHFDIRQYNFIVWEKGEDLYKELKNKIEANIIDV
jgi:nucleoside 2-deoxyribosyltransferase